MKLPTLSRKTVATFVLAQAARLCKVSFVIGAHTAMLSGFNMVSPLVGLFGGVLGSTVAFGVSLAVRYALFGMASLSLLAFYVPGWCAALYLATRHWSVRLVLPAVCMALFIAHPIGGAAWAYSLYWLLPMSLYFVQSKKLFVNALGATFTAHAVGSVIWVYTVGMTPAMWLGLIPVVACERLAFAAGMVAAYRVIQFASKRVSRMAFVKNYIQSSAL